jgi:hypothetical protein
LTRAERLRLRRRVALKREHRKRLAELAEVHWATRGPRHRAAYLERVRGALEAEGFRHTRLQWRHRGHSFGLVRDFGDKQIHVRVYDNGIVDAEVEISKRYLQHLYSPRPSAHRVIQLIFEKNHIPVDLINVHYVPRVGAHRKHYPVRRIPVAHLVGGAVIAGGMAAAGLVRLAFRRARGRPS